MVMRRLTRYITFELLKVFLMMLSVMTLLMMLVFVGQEAIRQGLGPVPILRLIPYFLPNALLFAVPGAILFATCSVMGSMSAANELVALKSLGIPPSVVLVPVMVTGLCLSLVTVWLNDVAMSWGRIGGYRVVLHSLEEIVYGMLRTKRSYSGNNNRFSINVAGVVGKKLIHPTISFYPNNKDEPIVVTAREAELRLNPSTNSLLVVLTDSEGDFGNRIYGANPDTFEYEIPLSAASRKGDLTGGPAFLPQSKIPEATREQALSLQLMQRGHAAEAAVQLLCGDFEELTSSNWKSRHQTTQMALTRLYRLHTEPWRRWANGFSCLFFVMVGAPLAIRMRTADVFTTFGLCFLPILIGYYPLLMYGVEQAKNGVLPPYAVWLGNLVLMTIGIGFILRVVRH